MAGITPKIAIIGAGPAGLMLASILHHSNISCTLFERDSSAVARAQGGTLDIHEYSGQRALDAAGLLDEFRTVMRQGGDAIRILTKNGTVLFEHNGEHEGVSTEGEDGTDSKFVKGRPEIDRPALKNLLIASLLVDTIHWSSKVRSVTPVPDSQKWNIQLDDDSEPVTFDLVVGADGAWSRTRALLTEQQPRFTRGITALDVWCHNVDEAAPDVSRFVGPGSCFLFEKDRGLFFQRNGQGSKADARCLACVKMSTLTPPSPAFSVKRILLAMHEQPVLRVTLVGDSAHLMTPFAGVGVNVAMMDALELVRGIVDCFRMGNADGEGLAVMLQQYEKGMFARSGEEAAKTEAAMHLQFQEGGAEKMVDIIKSAGSNPEDIVFE
ncbi:hypothetical protein NUW58_g3948 [Xylaria curta]|uniref:Uncharacterized protein n=1 Tax=Xylaria curta TaxID=42375 RepID=A0ACC1P9I9_9PEZI|nr:hypothetical protein NUW58_g3948 [Xylaria curta]